MRAELIIVGTLALLLCVVGCGGGSHNMIVTGPSPTPTPVPGTTPSPTPTPGGVPAADHVFVVVLENHSFSQVIGSSAMPFLNSLATQHSLAANYFADAHPSIGNYLVMTTGLVETLDDNFNGTIADDNLARAVTGVGKTWKSYAEGLPSAGYVGGNVGLYLKHHNPYAYLSDVVDTTGKPTSQAANIVPFTQLSADLAAGQLPNFGFIVPNSQDDAHDCPGGAATCADADRLAAADKWLQNNIGPLINSPAFANSVLIITFDEGNELDLANIGGQVATVIVGTHVKSGFRSTTFYQHQSMLRLVLDLLRIGDHPGLSGVAPTMEEFFQ